MELGRTQRLIAAGLNLAVCPSGNLNNVAHDAIVALLRVQRNIVPEGNRLPIFLQPNTPVLYHLVTHSVNH